MIHFTIYGERCSGTNYLEELMLANFNIQITWKYGWKHFFGFYNFEHNQEEDNTLFLGIIRNPVDWLNSFYKEQHHLAHEKKNLDKFLFSEHYSIDNKRNIVKEDLNYITNEKYI